MATIRLIPSTYYLSSTSYLSVSNEANMYANTDSNNYATITNTRNSTTAYYIYLRGFNFSAVPADAIINSFSIKLKGNYSGGYSQVMYLYNGTSTSMGSSQNSFSSSVTTHTFEVTSTWEDIVASGSNFGIRINCRRNSRNTTSYVYIYGAEIEVDYTIPVYHNITATLSTESVDSISPSGETTVLEGENYELSIYASSIEDIIVEDNGNDVTNQLVQHQNQPGETTISKTADSFTTGFSGGTSMNFYTSASSTGNNFNYAVGHTAESPGSTSSGSGSWTYIKEGSGSTNNTGYADFAFDFSEIPANAIIKSVQVKCYGAIESTSQSTSHADITLFSGSTQKGTMQKFTSTTNSVITISDPGTWTRAELQSAKLRFAVGYYGGHIFGITWSVTYEIPVDTPYYWTYALNNVSADHTIEVGDNSSVTRYLINTSIRTNGCSVNDASIKKKEGTDFTLIIYYSNINNLIITDNGTNINSLITGSSGTYYYALTNLSADHSIIITEKPWYEITVQSLYGSATGSISSNKIYENDSFTVTVNVSDISDINIKDNGEDVTSLFTRVSSGVYEATYLGTNDNHEFIIVEANSYSLTITSMTSGVSISPNGMISVRQGSSETFTLTSSIDWSLVILKDNSVDVTSNLTSSHTYTLSNITENHNIVVYEVFVPAEEDETKTYHSISISSINATTSPATGTIRVIEGSDQTITIVSSEPDITLATDNGVDISHLLVAEESTYDIVAKVSGASYGFELNSNDYYESTNNGVSKSASVARINFHMKSRSLVTIQYINYAEANYDYGMFGKIDTAVATDGLTASSSSSSPSDNTSNYQLAMASNSQSAQTITYTIERGEHFVDIKYGKDDASDDGNDSLQWKILSIQSLETNEFTYTLSNITSDHSLIFIFGEVVYYIVDSNGTGCKLYPTGEFVLLQNDSYTLTIIPDMKNCNIEIYDNGRDVTKNLERILTDSLDYYIYVIKKTTSYHFIEVTCVKRDSVFIKINGEFTEVSKVYKKISGVWAEIESYEDLFDTNKIYLKQ